jgi:hypothetical protein
LAPMDLLVPQLRARAQQVPATRKGVLADSQSVSAVNSSV